MAPAWTPVGRQQQGGAEFAKLLELKELTDATDAKERQKAPTTQKARRPTVVPVHQVQAEVWRPLQPTVRELKQLDFPKPTGPSKWGKTMFTCSQLQRIEGAEEALGNKYRRIAPEKELGEWSVDTAPSDHKHVALTGRGWTKARAMAGEALARWDIPFTLEASFFVPPVTSRYLPLF